MPWGLTLSLERLAVTLCSVGLGSLIKGPFINYDLGGGVRQIRRANAAIFLVPPYANRAKISVPPNANMWEI